MTTTKKARIRMALIAALVAVPLSLVGATPAHAVPSNCSYGLGSDVHCAWATCSAGNGSYRAWVQCRNWLGNYTTKYGTWEVPAPSGGNLSWAHCASNEQRFSYGYNLL